MSIYRLTNLPAQRANRPVNRLFAYIASQDTIPLPDDPQYDAHVTALNAMFDRDSINGPLCCDRITGIYLERVR